MFFTPVKGESYKEVMANFRWEIPEHFNIATVVCDRHAEQPNKVALVYEHLDGAVDMLTYAELRRRANQWANVVRGLGLQRGDRVAIYLPIHPAAPIVHIGCWKAALVSCPISTLFGEDAVQYRLNTIEARVVVTNHKNLPRIESILDRCPSVERVFVIDDPAPGSNSFFAALDAASSDFETVLTRADDPAYINFTSGTTGQPKGALAAHRAMLGHMPGLIYIYDWIPAPEADEVVWSPADWSWLAGLMDVLMPGLFMGMKVACWEPGTGFDPERALAFMARHEVTSALLVPTMLRMIRQVPNIERFRLKLRSILSGGEAVGTETINWAEKALGLKLNEGFGQTECNVMLGNNSRLARRVGALGLPVPGFECAIVDAEGNVLPAGVEGEIAAKHPHPIMLLEYWRNPDATRKKFAQDWLLTGDLGHRDEDGYFWFHGRMDDVITSSGYRIGPGEIEEALITHPAVGLAAAVGVPDPVKTESIKAFLVLRPGQEPSPQLADEIRDFVRQRLAKHEVPRDIEFVPSLPITVTGKILRRELRAAEIRKQQEVAAASKQAPSA